MAIFGCGAEEQALEFFFEHPHREIHLRELAREARLEPASAHRALHSLLKGGLVVLRRERHATYFKASLTPLFRAAKLAFTLDKFRKARLEKRILDSANGVSSIMLFGSAARGEDDEKSDYDVLVIARERGATSLSLSAKLDKEVSLKKFTLAEWHKAAKENRAFYLEAISSGVPIFGEKPVID